MKKLLSAAALSLGIAVSAPASAVIVGGIDFGPIGTTQHLELGSLAETYVNGIGQNLQGYGQVTTVNGNNAYCAGGGPNCGLYYYFNNYTVANFSVADVLFTGGVVDLYRYTGGSAINMLSQSSAANVAMITGGGAFAPWAELTGHTFLDPALPVGFQIGTLNGAGTLTGASLSETGSGMLDVNTSGAFGDVSVAAYLNANTIGDNLGGFTDVVMTSSSNSLFLNPNDSCTGTYGDWCLQGTINTRGNTVYVPEPGTLALLGLGLFGAGAVRRRKQSS